MVCQIIDNMLYMLYLTYLPSDLRIHEGKKEKEITKPKKGRKDYL